MSEVRAMFEGRSAIVTGGARGIGRAAAELLIEGGARVLLGDLDGDAVARAVAELGVQATGWVGDLTAAGAPEDLVSEAVDRLDRLDIVINNAGYTIDAPLHKLDDGAFQAMLDIHTIAPFRLLRAAAPHLRGAAKVDLAEGREVFRKVVNVTSAAAYGNPGQSNYAAAKAGLIGLTKTLAREWGPLGINVNAVAFGIIDTRLTALKTADSVIEISGREIQVGIPGPARQALDAMVPLGRAGTVREAAGGIAFLCSPWSDYVTGQVLNVTGGISLGMSG